MGSPLGTTPKARDSTREATGQLRVDGLAAPRWSRVEWPLFRLVFVVFGGLIVFWSSSTVNLIKLGYLIGVGLALAIAILGLRRGSLAPPNLTALMLVLSSMIFGLIAVSLPVSMAHATPLLQWLRDSAPYMLLGAVPIFALDSYSRVAQSRIITVLVVAGTLSSLATTVELLSRREVGLPIHQLLLPSPLLSLALLCFSFATAVLVTRHGGISWWFALAAFVLAQFFITGTRSSVLALVGPVLILVAAGGSILRRSSKLALLGAATAALMVISLGVAGLAGAKVTLLETRVATVSQLVRNPGSDESLLDRVTQTRTAWAVFTSAPLLGAGPGHQFVWKRAEGATEAAFTMDTPVTFLAKFGIVGLIVLVTVVVGYTKTIQMAHAEEFGRRARISLLGYGAVALAFALTENPLEDKGFALGLLLLLSLVLNASARWSAT